MACGSFGHCIICLSSVHGLWFIWPLYYLSFFCAWLVVHLRHAQKKDRYYNGQMNHKSCAEERQILQWPNEPQAMHRRKTDNTMAK
jgi:hypothetical protein